MSRLQQAMAAVRDNPRSAQAWADLGELLVAEGQIEKGKQSYQRALQLDPGNQAAQQGLAATLMAENSAPSPAPTPPKAPAKRPATPAAAPRAESGPKSPKSAPTERPETAPRPAVNPPRQPIPPFRSRGVTLRKKPPQVVRPTTGRMMSGLAGVGILLTLCVCGGGFALYTMLLAN